MLCTEAANFFRGLYSDSGMTNGDFLYTGCFPMVAQPFLDSLASVSSMSEVWDALRSMSPLKAPGPDGLHAEFYQKHWHIVRQDIYKGSVLKSKVYFSPNTDPFVSDVVCSVLGFSHTLSLGIYLGVPVFHQRKWVADFDFILSRLCAKLNGWVANSLSMAGHCTLAKSILAAIPAFSKQTIKLSASVCAEINKIVCGFIWGFSVSTGKISLAN
ncbi:hypothetical protein V6N12_034531 [Hibiscus sabdariffa]|uniref:Reverse transcriptase n=1 Tax=Hibiscus sabdariffa TaxID=183260 RepID=A0ABR2DIJ0_9ROSI